MEKIVINYYEYKLPEKNNWLQRRGTALSELFGYSHYRVDKSFTLNVETPDLFLNQKEFTISAALIGSAESAKFKILKWSYKAESETELQIEVSAVKIKPSVLEREYEKLSFQMQNLIPYFIFFALLIISFVGYRAYLFFPEPYSFWNKLGEIFPYIVVGLIIVIGSFSIYKAFAEFSKSVLKESFAVAGFIILTVFMYILWRYVPAPPVEIIDDPNYGTLYLIHLYKHFYTMILFFFGYASWIVIFLNFFGFNLLGSIIGKISADKIEKKK